MKQTMLDLQIHEEAVVADVCHIDRDMQRRLLDLGFSEGAVVKKVLTTPGANPAAYKVRGAVIALRAEDAKFVTVKSA